MRLFMIFFVIILFTESVSVCAAQYRSRELNAPKNPSAHNNKSIAELEQELESIDNAYSKASTAQFLARFYLSQGQDADLDKAITYYLTALESANSKQGLSIYAQQECYLELATIYFYKKKYAPFSDAVEAYIKVKGRPDLSLSVKMSVAFFHTQKPRMALKEANKVLAEINRSKNFSDLSLLQQLQFVFFQLKKYSKAIALQQKILNLDNQNLAQWLRLSQLYVQEKQYKKAAEVLIIALEKGFQLPQEQLIQLADLLAYIENPYAAAVHFSQFLQQGLLPKSTENYQKLFNYWWRAQDSDKAISALVKATALTPSADGYLNLAELYRQQMQWQLMQENVLSACEEPLDDKYISRSNLLLGVSELKLGNKASARQAFINATLVGGEGDKANQYLHYMQAPKPTDKELSEFYGPCKPRWASSGSKALNLAGIKGFALQTFTTEELLAQQPPDFSIESGQPRNFFYGEYTLPIADLESKLMPLVMKLAMFIVKNGGEISGNMHFIFPEPAVEGAQELSFYLAFPVSKLPRLKKRFKVLQEKGFYSARWVYEGAPQGVVQAWEVFYQSIISQGYTPTGEARQEILEAAKASSSYVKMELQIGLYQAES